MYYSFSKTVFNIDNNKKYLLTKSTFDLLRMTGVMPAENNKIKLHFKIYLK